MDPRFQKVLKDPRFKRMSKKDKKVKIDSRFEKMFTDERFHTKFTVDKRGKPLLEAEKEDLTKFYDMHSSEEEEEEEGEALSKTNKVTETTKQVKKNKTSTKVDKKVKEKNNNADLKLKKKPLKVKKEKKLSNKSKNDNNDDSGDDDDEGEVNFADIRGENVQDGGDSSDTEASDVEIDFDDLQEDIVHGWGDLDGDAKHIENAETSRLAVCNCDWDKISATDLFILFHSFKPTGGSIKSVTVYPSDYGMERLKDEDLNGPQELKDTVEDGEDDDDAVDDDGKAQGSHFHMEKLREYQLNRMKYYYAIVECDSKNTADTIYEECDGMEYEMSATRLDLRFVPDDTTFENPPKAVCKELPNIKNYQPSNFLNTALQQSTVRLTWDETDPKRLETTMRKFNKDDLESLDFKDYLASSSEGENDDDDVCPKLVAQSDDVENDDVIGSDSGDDEDQTERIKKYRLLMQEIEEKEKTENDVQEEGNMEVTWTPGMNAIGEKIIENKSERKTQNNSKKKKKEKKPLTHDEHTSSSDSEDDETELCENEISDVIDDENEAEEDLGFDDPFFNTTGGDNQMNDKKKKKLKKKKMMNEELTEEEKKQKDELELLLMDESEEKKHFNLKNILDQNKTKSKKAKRKRKADDKSEDTFQLDVDDPRFNALYTSHLYALDPADNHFKKTKATEAIIQEKQKRRAKGKLSGNTKPENENKKADPSLSALVSSVKSKTLSHQSKKRKKLK